MKKEKTRKVKEIEILRAGLSETFHARRSATEMCVCVRVCVCARVQLILNSVYQTIMQSFRGIEKLAGHKLRNTLSLFRKME